MPQNDTTQNELRTVSNRDEPRGIRSGELFKYRKIPATKIRKERQAATASGSKKALDKG